MNRKPSTSNDSNTHQSPTSQPSNKYRSPLFALGQVVATQGALALLDQLAASGVTVSSLLRRHVCGDWVHMDAEDRAANIQAVEDRSRILTSFEFQSDRLWIITEAMSDITEDGQAKRHPSRSSTCLLLPEEY